MNRFSERLKPSARDTEEGVKHSLPAREVMLGLAVLTVVAATVTAVAT